MYKQDADCLVCHVYRWFSFSDMPEFFDVKAQKTGVCCYMTLMSSVSLLDFFEGSP
jgi:hypothetical protein